MKKHVILIAVLFAVLSLNCYAQAVYIPNGEMENWTTVGSYEDPTSWGTSNLISVSLFAPPVVYKDTNAHTGNYAARLETKNTAFGNIPGAIGTGVINFTTQTFDGGFPLTNPAVTGFGGFYKYSPVGNDSAFFFAILTKWNVNKRDTVATAFWLAGAQANYTEFQIPFITLIPGESADTCLVAVANAFDILNAHVGTVLWVDQMDLSDLLTVQEITPASLQMSPNPADQSLVISLPQELDAQSVLVASADGKMMREIHSASSSSLEISTAKFAPGLYIALVKNKEGKEVAAAKFYVSH